MVLTPLAIAVGLLIGFLRGGRFDAVRKNQVLAWPLLAAGVVLQTVGESFDVPGRAVVVVAGLLCLVGAAMKNIHIPGAAVAGIGVTLNLAVLVVNGHVPVSFDALTAFGNDIRVNPDATGLWQLDGDDTSLSFLGDVVPTPWLNTPVSFGDLIMLAGLAVIAMNVVLKGRKAGIDPDDLFAEDDRRDPGLGLPGLGPDSIIDASDEIDLRDEPSVVIIGSTAASEATGSVELVEADSIGSDTVGFDTDVRDALFSDIPDFDDNPIELSELGADTPADADQR